VHVYEGARHGFFDPERPTEYDPRAAALAWSRTLEFLAGIGAR
jgi:carboxymethylenebutenolidase